MVILGPTAVGKSAVAEHLAQVVGGEIVGADSMQVYKDLDIGTAKPDAASLQRVCHHLIDAIDPRVDFNLGEFVRAAEEAVQGIGSRGKVPILVGGTGMYVRGFLKGVDPAPPREPRVRAALETLADRRGESHLHYLLMNLDPEAAGAIGPADRMRLVRALERLLCSGRPARASSWSGPDRYASVKVGLEMESSVLRERIEARVDAMFRHGLVEETERLIASLPPEASALKALGYREVVQLLSGESDLEETVRAVKRNTWKFSRRQMTWFRREEGVHWIRVHPGRAEDAPRQVEKYVTLSLSCA